MSGGNHLNNKDRKLHKAEYRAWKHMRSRCGYSGTIEDAYVHVMICDRWLQSFDNFLEDMGSKPGPNYDLDRIRQEGNYEPLNCQWLERIEHRHKTQSDRKARHDESLSG